MSQNLPRTRVYPEFRIIAKCDPNSLYYTIRKDEHTDMIMVISSPNSVIFTKESSSELIAQYLLHRVNNVDEQLEMRSTVSVWFDDVTKENLVLAIDLLKNTFMITEYLNSRNV